MTGTNAIVDEGVEVAAAVPASLAVLAVAALLTAAAVLLAAVVASPVADPLELWQPASRPIAVADTAAINSPPLIALLAWLAADRPRHDLLMTPPLLSKPVGTF